MKRWSWVVAISVGFAAVASCGSDTAGGGNLGGAGGQAGTEIGGAAAAGKSSAPAGSPALGGSGSGGGSAPGGEASLAGNGGDSTTAPGGAGTNTGGSGEPGGESAGGAGDLGAFAGAGGEGGASEPRHTAIPTLGCGAADPREDNQIWLKADFDVTGLPTDQQATYTKRRYGVRLPVGYDHTRAYPVIVSAMGCGSPTVIENAVTQTTAKNDAIHVSLATVDSCYTTYSAPSPDVPYFDQVLTRVQAKYCTDSSRVFVSGYSSGGVLAHLLACASGDRIRGVGVASGDLGAASAGYTCKSPATGQGAVILRGNEDGNITEAGALAGRDRLIAANGCDPQQHEVWRPKFSNNVDYCQLWHQGCESSPVVYCALPGGHILDTPERVSERGWWELWSELYP